MFQNVRLPQGLQLEAERQLEDEVEWGGALQTFLASRLWEVSIHVHVISGRPIVFQGGVPRQWHMQTLTMCWFQDNLPNVEQACLPWERTAMWNMLPDRVSTLVRIMAELCY